MFHNPGAKIKSYAKVLFWIGVVISALLGVVTIGGSFVAASYMYSNTFGTILGGFIKGIIVTGIGVLISWVSVLSLYGFGVLVENSDTLVSLNGGIPSGDVKPEHIQMPHTSQQFHEYTQYDPQQPTNSNTCPNCGQQVDENANFCKHCGSSINHNN